MLRLREVSFSYGPEPFMEGVSLEPAEGELTAVCGANGSGKTTLLKLAAGLLVPAAGKVEMGGRDAGRLEPAERARLVSWLPQFPAFPPAFTVLEGVMQGLYPRRRGFFDREEDVRRAMAALERVGCAGLADRRPETLSGGERQRAAVARALVQDTPVLLLDEPAAHLDAAHAAGLFGLLVSLAREGRTVAVVTHDVNLALAFADSIVLMKGGRIIAQGRPDEALTERTFEECYGLGCTLVDRGDGRKAVLPDYGRGRSAAERQG